MGISYQTFRKTAKNKQKYLSRLENYCKFKEVYGGVIIEEIYIDTYDKNLIRSSDLTFMQSVSSAPENLSTISGINRSTGVSSYLLSKSRNKLFGNGEEIGLCGYRNAVWAIKVDNFNHYRSFTQEEEDMFDALVLQVYGTTDVQTIKAAALLDDIYKNSETMTKEEFFMLKEYRGYNFFDAVIEKFREATGEIIVRANKYNLIDSLPLEGNEKDYRDWLFKEVK